MKHQKLHELWLLSNDFTQENQTPWAGDVIYESYKKHLPWVQAQKKIGESWEFSYRSQIQKIDKTIEQFLEEHPESYTKKPEIMLKILHASTALSVQVHPFDDNPHLGVKECGKTEAWLVLEAKPGAGVYIGFSHALSKKELQTKLEKKVDLSTDLNFIPVKSGDYFFLEPGTIHALGPDVTILEPQQVKPGFQGKTYRLWDWNRLYDGKARDLHVKEALELIDPEKQVGQEFLKNVFFQGNQNGFIHMYPPSDFCQLGVLNLKKNQIFQWNLEKEYGLLTVLEGELSLPSYGQKGQTAFFPKREEPYTLCTETFSKAALMSPWPFGHLSKEAKSITQKI